MKSTFEPRQQTKARLSLAAARPGRSVSLRYEVMLRSMESTRKRMWPVSTWLRQSLRRLPRPIKYGVLKA
jgi:hypothetical protein